MPKLGELGMSVEKVKFRVPLKMMYEDKTKSFGDFSMRLLKKPVLKKKNIRIEFNTDSVTYLKNGWYSNAC